MIAPYDPELMQLARRTASDLSIPTHKGVLVSVPGPNLETRAEYSHAAGLWCRRGQHVDRARSDRGRGHAGLRTLGFSIVTDMCLPDALEPVKIERILEVAGRGGKHLERLIPAIVARLATERPGSKAT